MRTMSQNVAEDIECASRSTANVLISGGDRASRAEVAQIIHAQRGRAAGPLLRPDDAAPVPEYPGGSTVFIEEVGELSSPMQKWLMRLLDRQAEPRTGERLFGLIAGTRYDLIGRIANASFDARLFYRLNVIHIMM